MSLTKKGELYARQKSLYGICYLLFITRQQMTIGVQSNTYVRVAQVLRQRLDVYFLGYANACERMSHIMESPPIDARFFHNGDKLVAHAIQGHY